MTLWVHLELLLVQVLFAGLALSAKRALDSVPANALVLARVALGSIAFLLLARAWGQTFRVRRRDLKAVVACSLLGIVINQLLFVNGLARTTAVNATVIGCTIPVFVAALAMITRREPFSARRTAGIAVAFGGTLALVGIDHFDLTDGHVAGNLMILTNALSYAAFLVYVRPLALRLPAMTLVAALFLVGTPFVLPFGLAAWIEVGPHLGAGEVAWVLVVVAFTVAAYAVNQHALARADASAVALYIYLQPILAAVGAVVLLGERPGLRTAVSGAVILTGLAIATFRRP